MLPKEVMQPKLLLGILGLAHGSIAIALPVLRKCVRTVMSVNAMRISWRLARATPASHAAAGGSGTNVGIVAPDDVKTLSS